MILIRPFNKNQFKIIFKINLNWFLFWIIKLNQKICFFYFDSDSPRLKGKNIFLGHFLSFWKSSIYESKYFGPDRSVWAENLPVTLFLYEKSEKSGPETICWPPRFQYGWFLQTLALNWNWILKRLQKFTRNKPMG